MKEEYYKIIQNDEYKEYISALCSLASEYIPEIRIQFAKKALENYQNETIRKLVIEYGEELKKLKKDRLREFEFAAEYAEDRDFDNNYLSDFCLNNAAKYGEAIKFLFDIKFNN